MPAKRRPGKLFQGGELLELEFLKGLSPFVLEELKRFRGAELLAQGEDTLQLRYRGHAKDFLGLRCAVAVYLVTAYDIPRPKAFLGDQHFRRLVGDIDRARSLHPAGTFGRFRFSAAGSDSSVFERLADAIAKATGLRFDPDEGELLLRIRRARETWEVLTRLTPRPLSARPWRVCNLAGGLNASLAAAMNNLAGLRADERYLNAMCGSGTLLIEALLGANGARFVGCDVAEEALTCARQNVAAAGLANRLELLGADATRLPFEASSFEVITADVPWGDAVGTHQSNTRLYPAFLQEAARVAAPGARLAVLTHDIRLFERVLTGQANWQAERAFQVYHGGHYPTLYVLTLNGSR